MTSSATVALDLAGRSPAAAARRRLRRTSTATPVVVAVPAWFGMADRHQLVSYLDRNGAWPLGLASSTLAGALGHFDATTNQRPKSSVLCLDVRRGWSAGLIRVEPDGLTEVASWGIPPGDVAGRLADAATCTWLVEHLFAASSAIAGTGPIGAVLVIDDAGVRASLVREAVRQCDLVSAECKVVVDRGRCVAKGAARVHRSDDLRGSVGALAHALTVRADGDPQRVTMHVVAAEHALFPSTTRQMFELGRDDGSPLHFDIYEQHRSVPGDGAIDHRLVVRAHLVRERGFDQNMLVTFELGANGLLSIGPVKAWNLEWEPGSLSLDGRR